MTNEVDYLSFYSVVSHYLLVYSFTWTIWLAQNRESKMDVLLNLGNSAHALA